MLQVYFFDLTAKALLAVAAIVLIRYTPEHDYAAYTFALALATLLYQTIASTFNRIYIIGFDTFQLRHEQSAFLWLQIWGLVAVAVVLSPLSSRMGATYVFAVGLAAANCLAEYFKTELQRRQQFLRYSMTELGRATVTFAAVLALVLVFGHSMPVNGILFAQAAAVGALILLVFYRSINFASAFRIRSAARLAADIARGGYKWLLAYFLVLSAFGQIDVLMLKAMAGRADLATYGAAFRYYSLLSLALAAVHAVLLPVIRQLSSLEALNRVMVQHRRFTMLFAAAVVAFGWAAQWILPWIDLGKYPDSVGVLRVLCISAVISFAFSPHVNIVMRYERFRLLTGLILVTLAVAVVLNALLIPMFGAIGAAWATLVASASFNVPIAILSRRLTAVLPPMSPAHDGAG